MKDFGQGYKTDPVEVLEPAQV
ncbi:hypothetical protein CVT26_011225 [Gymnopilus dilepis]|uniref:Uncharacterized protein n=1 Tax=Gymnopilus dilepis TaxID=231916 RepID=A0A409VJS0_9AGAR|nr:hypothetical protein CVT26_011225 [Gymnopilus dilepis]